jgi:hypothetical protein
MADKDKKRGIIYKKPKSIGAKSWRRMLIFWQVLSAFMTVFSIIFFLFILAIFVPRLDFTRYKEYKGDEPLVYGIVIIGPLLFILAWLKIYLITRKSWQYFLSE